MKKIIVGNWKMNPLAVNEAKVLFASIKKQLKATENAEVVVCPPFVYLPEVKKLSNGKIKLGAQNSFWEEKGAFTGEISSKMIKNIGCKYVILGHSERRIFLKETDEIILQKIKSVLQIGLSPILCIGEKKEEKKEGDTFEALKKQLKNTLFKIPSTKMPSVVIAYEPIWAIGTGDNCPPNEAMTVLMFIKKQIMRMSFKKNIDKIAILYGGSVNSKNAKCYIDAGFDGLLVGGASLKPGDFCSIVKNCS